MAFVTAAIITGGIAAGAGIGGAMMSSNAAQNAANTQAGASDRANQMQWDMYQQQRQDQQPWRQAGATALSQMQDPSFQKTFTMDDFKNNVDPAYQFDMQQGQQAIQRSAAARGGLQTGGTLKSLNNYAQNQASNEYQNAYGRFMNNQNTQFNRLASIAGVGQTANNQVGQAGMATAGAMGQNVMGAANASGAAQIAQGNAWGNALSGIGSGISNNWMQYQQMNNMNNWMNKMYPGGTT